MKVAFHSGYLGFRGTEVALVDYGRGNREVLGGESFFVLPWRDGGDAHPVVREMRKVGPVHFYRNEEERESILQKEKPHGDSAPTSRRPARGAGNSGQGAGFWQAWRR